ncbi:MAG: TIGR03619 family F420-dependent LLM class oxidoreductase [Anaerolineales bacterium]
MQFGISLPNYGDAITPLLLCEAAKAAEEAGWDGIFLWDHILVSKNQGHNMVDPWVALGAMAAVTERIRLGTTVTPIARRRPWKLARETVTLDHLSGGRLTLSVGLGAPEKAEFGLLGETTSKRIRAEKLDEGLEILMGLWSGKAFEFHGKHFQLSKVTFKPGPIQKPRIPIWVGGYSSRKAPFRRAARFDGAFPLKSHGEITAKDLRDIQELIDTQRKSDDPYDLVSMGSLLDEPPTSQERKLTYLAATWLTWWLESLFQLRSDGNALLTAIRLGPPGRDRL